MKSSRTILIALSTLALVGVALAGAPTGAGDAAHAAGDHAHEVVGAIPSVKQGIATGITALIVFALVAAFLQVVVWPKISKGLEDRASKIREEIEAAEMAQQQARTALEQYERNLAQARAEAQKMLDDTKSQQQALALDLRAKAEVELNQLREKAKRDIEQAKKAAISEVHDHATALAMQIAGKILRREIGPQDQQRLVHESLQELQGVGQG